MRHLITVTTFFPNSADRHRAIFVANLVRALRRLCEVSVVSPVVYAPPVRCIRKWRALRNIAAREIVDDAVVFHPRFAVFPKLAWLSGVTYCLGILSTIDRLRSVSRNSVLHAHFAYPDGVGVALAARLLRLPYIITVHGSDINVYSTHRTLWPQMQWALRNAAYVIVVSRDLETKVRTRSHGAVNNLFYIPCAGFNPALFFPRDRTIAREKLNQIVRSKIVLFVGQLVAIKGVEYLLEAWNILLTDRRLSKFDKLVIVGEGDYCHKLKARAAKLGLGESIGFTGALKQTEIADWLAAADLLCLPSLNEGTPNVVIEAMASGRAVVATNVGGLPEIVEQGKNGILVQPADSLDLAEGLAIALSTNWIADSVAASVAYLTWDAIASKNKRLLDEHFPEKNSVPVG